MKINLFINPEVDEHIDIYAKEMTETIQHWITLVDEIDNHTSLNGKIDNKIYILSFNDIAQFVIENKKLYAISKKNIKYELDYKLYEIENKVTRKFVRISKSELINIDEVDHLELEAYGSVKMVLKNGNETFVSRKYLKGLKERLL